MDLIYTDANRVDQGVLLDYELDLAFGADENNFECRIQSDSHCCEAGSLLYMEGTEYGGIVDGIEVDSETDEVVYTGRTWHGIIGSKVIVPLLSSDTSTSSVTLKTADANGSLVGKYLVISGDANACISFILSRIGLSALFSASESLAGVNISQYRFNRYTDAYTGIVKMLDSAGMKIHVAFQDGVAVLSAVKKRDYTQEEEFSSDMGGIQFVKRYRSVNHLICLGSGEMENRTVIHLYVDKAGNISQEQTQTGLDEYVEVLDYSNVESDDELINVGTEKLKSLWATDELSMDFDVTEDLYDVGDIIGAMDRVTGITVSAAITKKIVTIRNGQITVSYDTATHVSKELDDATLGLAIIGIMRLGR